MAKQAPPAWPGFPAPPPPGPRDAALEAAIRADPTADTVAVYADWLQQHGNPLGELIIARQAAEPPSPKRGTASSPPPHRRRRPSPAELALAERAAAAGLPGDAIAHYGWRAGIWQWLRVDNTAEASVADITGLVALVEGLYASPLACALDELRLGVLHWDTNHRAVPDLVARAAPHAWAAQLRKLHVGATEDIDLAHQTPGTIGPAASAAFPALRALHIRGAEQDLLGADTFGLGGLALPQLTTLIVETCTMSGSRIAELCAARLPALENCELWFGARDRGADATLTDLAPILEGRVHPHLKRLGLVNSELGDEVAHSDSLARLAPRLVELDLSMGTLTDAGADALVARRAAFRALRTLVVDDNFLSADAVARVRAAFDGVEVVANSQKLAERYQDDVYRYVTVAE